LREILHVSDVHFGPRHVPAVSDGVLHLVERRTPDLVVVSGDLTQRARSEQFREAREWIDRFTVPTISVPGNHDVPLWRFWERIFAPYRAYRRWFAEDLEPSWQDEELHVVGINTAHGWTHKNGRIPLGRLREVARELSGSERRFRVVVAHHHLDPGPRFDSQRLIRNAHESVELFTRLGVDLVLSGHLHQCYHSTSEAWFPSGRRPFLILHAGTTTSSRGRGAERRRNTCNWIRVEEETLEFSHLSWCPDREQFRELSRHRFPRRDREPFALELV